MTEIPEHLLKRAAARRAELAGGDAPAAEETTDATAAATGDAVDPAAAAKPAKKQAPLPTLDAEPAPAVPDSPVVAAARSRKRVPFWAAPVLALLPLWAFIYVFAVQPPPAGENDPLVIGKEVYSSAGCLGCHGATGEGGAGQKLNEGDILKTFKDPLEQVHWIAFGAAGGARDDGSYGDTNRPGGPRNIDTLTGVMAPYGDKLSPEELAAVVIYIRTEFGADAYDPKAKTEQGFVADAFEADPAALTKEVEETIAVGEGGDPDLKEINRGE